MEYLLTWDSLSIVAISVIAGFISVFSGFGVSIAMLPLLVLFFPMHIAIAFAAMLSIINNTYKLILFKPLVSRHILLLFGIPAAIMSVIGAKILLVIWQNNVIIDYEIFGHVFETKRLNLIIGILIICFTIVELLPRFKVFSPHKLATLLSGVISGFFGGISGYQGGFQAAILLKLNMPLRQFITTSGAISMMIDVPRIIVYSSFFGDHIKDGYNTNIWPIILITIVCTSIGTYMAYRYTERVTAEVLKYLVMAFTFIIGIALVFGKI